MQVFSSLVILQVVLAVFPDAYGRGACSGGILSFIISSILPQVNLISTQAIHVPPTLPKSQVDDAVFPPASLCGDNAAMIAMVGLEKFKLNQFDALDYPAKPRWALDEEAKFLKGAGVRL